MLPVLINMKDTLRNFFKLAVLNPQEEDILALRASYVSWDKLARISFELNSSYIFYTNIKRLGLEPCFSSRNIELLQAEKESAISHNLIQIKFLYEITELLQTENIKFIPLKGLSLITNTYPDIGMRTGSDLDIFIHPADFDICAEVLRKSSYKFEHFLPSLIRGTTSDHGQACMVRSQHNLYIDIHYRLFTWYEEKYIFKIDSTRFYENTVSKLWKGRNIDYMKKEDEFYYLLMCIFRNRFGNFRYYLDADAILKIHGAEFDWDLLKTYLWRSPLKQYWKYLLKFMRDRLKTPITDELVVSENDGSEKAYLSLIDRNIMNPHINDTKIRLFYLRSAHKFTDKLALVLLFLKWKLFKRFGCFRNFFIAHNNPSRNGT
jgi:hypothetical protein